MLNPHLKQVLQNMLNAKFKVGQIIQFYEKLTPGFRGKYSDSPQTGKVIDVKHPFVVVLANSGETHYLYDNEIKP